MRSRPRLRPAFATAGSYRPGTSLLHRLGAAQKLGALTAIGSAGALWRSAASSAALVAVGLLALAISRPGRSDVVHTLRKVTVVPALVAVYQVWQRDAEHAFVVAGNLAGILLLAAVFTAVTPVDAVLDTLTGLVGPLRRFGVRPEAVSMAFSLMMRSIPATLETAREARHAALARGLDRSARAHMLPLALRTIARARTTAEALHARSLLDDP